MTGTYAQRPYRYTILPAGWDASCLLDVLQSWKPLGDIFTMFDILDTKTSIRLAYKKFSLFLRSNWSKYVLFFHLPPKLSITGISNLNMHIIPGFLLTTRIFKVVEATGTSIMGLTTRLGPYWRHGILWFLSDRFRKMGGGEKKNMLLVKIIKFRTYRAPRLHTMVPTRRDSAELAPGAAPGWQGWQSLIQM